MTQQISSRQIDHNGGWIAAAEPWALASTDGSTTVFNAAADVTGKYSEGMRVKYTQDQALSHYWTFDTNSTPDVGSATMADIGTPTYTAGKFGNALTLNGTNQALAITDAAAFKPTGEFTIGCWFKTSNTGAVKVIYQSYSDNTNANGIGIYINTANAISFFVGNNAASNSTEINGTTTVTDGNWHYVVWTHRNNWGQVYLDGNLELSGYMVTPTYAATNYVRIGCYNVSGSNSGWFNGQIDDLFLINGYALDEKTIKAKYLAQTAQGTGNITVQKYGLITAVGAYSGGNTPITIWGGTDYSTANATISNPYYSGIKVPFGFDINPAKWTVEVSDTVARNQASPTTSTWYNLGSLQISVPIGKWSVQYQVAMAGATTAAQTASFVIGTLSAANNSESDTDMTTFAYVSGPSGTWSISGLINRVKFYNLSSKKTFYLNARTTQSTVNSISFAGDSSKTIIRATSTLL